MCEALRELMKDEIEQDVAKGIVETCCDFGAADDAIIERLQRKLNIPLQTAQKYLQTYGKQMA